MGLAVIAYFLDGSGFLLPKSRIGADLSLIVTVVAVVMLTVGVVFARSRRYGAHHWMQTAAVTLNAVPVVFWMIRSLRLFILPGLPGTLSERGHTLAAVHALTGAIGVALGVFIVIRANQLFARGESLARYKNVMRVAYVIYLLAAALGVALYVVTYG